MNFNKWTIAMIAIVAVSFVLELVISALGRRYSNDLAELLVICSNIPMILQSSVRHLP